MKVLDEATTPTTPLEYDTSTPLVAILYDTSTFLSLLQCRALVAVYTATPCQLTGANSSNAVDWHLLHSAGDSVEFPGASHSVRNRKSPTLHPLLPLLPSPLLLRLLLPLNVFSAAAVPAPPIDRDWSRSRLMSAPLLLPLPPPPTARVERQRDTSPTTIPIPTLTRRPTMTVSTNTSFTNCHLRTRRWCGAWHVQCTQKVPTVEKGGRRRRGRSREQAETGSETETVA